MVRTPEDLQEVFDKVKGHEVGEHEELFEIFDKGKGNREEEAEE